MSNMVGAMVGAAIDRQDGDSGIKGAVIGAVTQGALKIALPIAVTFGIGWLLQYSARRAWQRMSNDDPVSASS
jgi:hypothetical protein